MVTTIMQADTETYPGTLAQLPEFHPVFDSHGSRWIRAKGRLDGEGQRGSDDGQRSVSRDGHCVLGEPWPALVPVRALKEVACAQRPPHPQQASPAC